MFGLQNLGGLIITLVTLPFVIILLVLIAILARSARKASASTRWPMTNGRILSSQVRSHRSLNSSGTHTTIYEPEVSYEYNANGQDYQSKQVSFGMVAGASWTGWAESVVEKYPEGSLVQVSYNPTKPDEAVLEHSGSSGSTFLILILIVVELILVGLVLLGVTGHFG